MRGAPMKHSRLSKGESGGELPRDLDPLEIGVQGDESFHRFFRVSLI